MPARPSAVRLTQTIIVILILAATVGCEPVLDEVDKAIQSLEKARATVATQSEAWRGARPDRISDRE